MGHKIHLGDCETREITAGEFRFAAVDFGDTIRISGDIQMGCPESGESRTQPMRIDASRGRDSMGPDETTTRSTGDAEGSIWSGWAGRGRDFTTPTSN